jgi:hypothetical protein
MLGPTVGVVSVGLWPDQDDEPTVWNAEVDGATAVHVTVIAATE